MASSTDRIEKRIELKAPVSKVWKAITDSQQFGQWFGCRFEAPFAAGKKAQGKITSPGFENFKFEIEVKAIEPEKRFAFHWHPYAIDPKVDYSKETPTLVEFLLEKAGQGTKLTVIESGFDQVPAARRAEAFKMNGHGWDAQLKNIEKHVGQGA
jgi:uncharacterized protein YndB with AHSA1/START domain